MKGRTGHGYEPVLEVRHEQGLSFYDLLELHALHTLRRVHGVKLGTIRKALDFAEKELHIDRLLLRDDLQTFGKQMFVDHLGELIGLSMSGQIALRTILDRFMSRVERDAHALPIRFFPEFSGADAVPDKKPVSISPRVAFGKPTVSGTGIQTSVLAARLDGGETVAELADDYGLDEVLVETAVTYEKAA